MVFETILGMDAENVLQGRQKVKNMNDQKTLYRAGTQDSKICTSYFFTFRRPCNTFSASIPDIVSKAVGYRKSIA